MILQFSLKKKMAETYSEHFLIGFILPVLSPELNAKGLQFPTEG
jgi:hypothetical protein